MAIRRLQAGEESAAIRLADKVFRDQDQKSMGLAFPTLFSRGVIEHSYGCFVDGQLVSFMGLAPSTIRVGKAKLSVYSLGSVCTDPDFRGKGYASWILEAILADLHHTEASLMFVSGGLSLYTKVGYCRFGKSYTCLIKGSSQEATKNNGIIIREAQAGDIHSMESLASKREVAFEQTAHDIALLSRAESYASCMKRHHKILIAEKDGRITAFLIIAIPFVQGASQDALVIEQAGNVEGIKSLVYDAVNRYSLEQLECHIPWHEKDLISSFSDVKMQAGQNEGTVYVVDPEKLLKQLAPYLEEKGVCNVEQTDDGVSVFLNEKPVLLTNEEFISYMFNPDFKCPSVSFKNHAIPLPYVYGLNYI